jgi:hypothetical protein
MRKSLMGVLVLAAMAVGASTAKASAVEIDVYSPTDTVGNRQIGLLGTDIGTLPNGWEFAVVATSNSPLSQPVFALQSYTVFAECQSVTDPCATHPLLNLLYVAVSSRGFDTVSGFFTALSVTDESTDESTAQDAWYNTANAYFDTGTSIGVVGVTGPASIMSPQSRFASVGVSSSGPYSLEILDVFDSGGTTDPFEATGDIGATPEPRTMLLFGSGLLVFAGILRRRQRA